MTENQKKIVGTVLMNTSPSVPVTEEAVEMMVDMYDDTNNRVHGTPRLTFEERKEVIALLHSILLINMDHGHGNYVKEKDHKPWYIAAKAKTSSNFWQRYIIYLQKEENWNNKIINALDQATDEIMDLLGNPSQAEGFLRRGLCIGDVQSGKTSTYIGLINKAADIKYRVIILLTGTIEKLRRQTQKRIDEGFIGLDSYAFTLEKDSVQVGVGVIDPSTSGWAVTSTTSDFNAATAKKIVGKLDSIKDPVIFVLKKNKSVLEKLERWLRFYNASKVTKKINLPMLLIDDEADNASINTKSDDVTAINKGIRKLLNLFEKVNYVGFTATPYANIFIDPDSEQEMLQHDLFPRDFIYALEAPSNYIGARLMFGENAPYGYMVETNDDCDPALPIKHKKEDNLRFIPETLKEAIASFIIANTIRDLRGDTKSHRTMMINISRFIDVQNQITKVIDSYFRNIRREIHNYYLLGEEALRYSSISFIKKVYEKYFSAFVQDDSFSDLKHFSWDIIQAALYPAIKRVEIRSINGGNASENLDYENYEKAPDDIGLRLIAIGGLSLSRGLTLEGLCISYYYRNSAMYDTIMQMGRWFGYRNKYRDLCKVWMPSVSISWYSYISQATDELRAEVRRMQSENRTPKDFGLKVRSDVQGLFVTAKNKMRTAKDYEMTINFSGEVIETRYVHSSKEILNRNIEEATNFIQCICAEGYKMHKNDPNLAIKHPQFLNVEKKLVIGFLKKFSVHTLNMDFIIHDLVKMFADDSEGVFDNWDILIAQGLSQETVNFAGIENIIPVKRSFAYKDRTKSIQMSGKSSRLGSKDLAKGGLSRETVKKMEEGTDNEEKTFSEDYYFKTGLKRNPLLVIYPVRLIYEIKDGETEDPVKRELTETINYPVVGMSIGIPMIKGKKEEKIKYKINKQKWLEIFGADSPEDFHEIDETIPEE